jgi:predicted RNA-binding protein with PUA-like domain
MAARKRRSRGEAYANLAAASHKIPDRDARLPGEGEMNFLFKEEPTHYSYDDLVRDAKTSWTGVKNPLAQKHLRSVKKGDRIFYYHTGDEKAVVAVAKAAGDAYPDPKDASGKLFAVDVVPVRKLPRRVTLAEIKASAAFRDFPLVRISRLSVMPVSEKEWAAIEKLALR